MKKQVVFIGTDHRFGASQWENRSITLEKDKVYTVIYESSYNYYINNPVGNGGQLAFAKENFITIQDYRDNKLKQLINAL